VGSTGGRRWRRSIQIRVVVTTLLVSSVVVLLFASLLLDSVGRGLVQAKTRASLAEARSGAVLFEARTSQSTRDAESREQMLEQAVTEIGRRGSGSVVLLGRRG
jgi:two-component system sensor histidine kinase MtrB